MNAVEMRTKTAMLLARCGELAQQDELTPEQKAEFDGKLAEAQALDERIEQLAKIETMQKSYVGGDGEPKLTTRQPEPKVEWKSLGEQLLAVARAERGEMPDPRLRKQLGTNEGVPADGGFLVQPTYANDLLRRTYELGQIVSRCRRLPLGPNSNRLIINAIAETSRALGSRWGGIQAYWLAEGGTKLPSHPTWRQMQMVLHKLVGLCYATDELLQDTTALSSVISQGFAEEFSFQIEDAIIRGTGAGQPMGILVSPSLVTVPIQPLQANTTIVTENVVNMWSRMWGRSRANAVWLINQDVEPELYTMTLAVGTGGVPVYMPAGGLSGQPYGTLFGRPVLPCEYCSTLGTVGDIILADFSQYLVIDKGGMTSDSSIHVAFTTDETAFRFVYRIDGQPAWNAPLIPFQGAANTVSPFVTLAGRP